MTTMAAIATVSLTQPKRLVLMWANIVPSSRLPSFSDDSTPPHAPHKARARISTPGPSPLGSSVFVAGRHESDRATGHADKRYSLALPTSGSTRYRPRDLGGF